MKPNLLLIMAVAVTFACGSPIYKEGQIGTKAPRAADPVALWTFISATSPFRAWPLFPERRPTRPGSKPHGPWVTTYANPVAEKGIAAKIGRLEPGSILVAEQFSEDKKPTTISVMYRVGESPAGENSWFWVQYDLDGRVLGEGESAGCPDCHRKVAFNDSIFTGPVR